MFRCSDTLIRSNFTLTTLSILSSIFSPSFSKTIFFFLNDPATTEIYTLSLHDALPICRTLQVAPSTYYACKARPPSARAVADEQLKVEIRRVWDDNFQVYGAEKLWRQLGREAIQIGRDRVARLMRTLGIRGSCAAPSGPPPPPPMLTSAPPTSSTATSPRRRPTACGSPTSPTCPPGRDSATPRSSSTPTAAPSWAGGSRPPCGPPWPWTPWRWPSGPARTPAWRRWCITPTAACST